jgi:hypothetical protein
MAFFYASLNSWVTSWLWVLCGKSKAPTQIRAKTTSAM